MPAWYFVWSETSTLFIDTFIDKMYAFSTSCGSVSVFSPTSWQAAQIRIRRPSPKVTIVLSRRKRSTIYMSGVNGGIDYEIDVSTLPTKLADRVRKVEQGADTATELIEAAEELAEASADHPQLLPVLVDMLGYNNPVAANVAMDALVSSGSAAVSSLLIGVAAFNYSVNAYALRTLARIGDPSVASVAAECASRAPIPNVRRAACRALGALRYQCSEDASKAYTQLVLLADREPDWGVRYAAIVALEAFQKIELLSERLVGIAIDVVKAAGEGRSYVVPEWLLEVQSSSDKSPPPLSKVERPTADGTVMARANVALDSMRTRYQNAVFVSGAAPSQMRNVS